MKNANFLIKNEPWINHLLQGLTFWIGYKHHLYPHHPIKEGAIQNEALALINSSLNDGDKVHSEKKYSSIGSRHSINKIGHEKADIFIEKRSGKKIVIEIKRHPNRKGILYDFRKMLDLKISSSKDTINCYLLLIGQGKIPKTFVDKDSGTAFRGNIEFENEFILRVRRVCKTSSTFREKKAIKNANYACLIEVVGCL